MSCARNLLSTMDGGRVLDAGCGTGRFTRLLADELRSLRTIVGIDPDKESLDEARRQSHDRRIIYRKVSILDIAEDPERFETISIAYALHHIVDPASALARLVSVLLRHGALIVSEACSDGLSAAQRNGRDVHHFKAAIDRLRGMEHRETYTADGIRSLIQKAGVLVVDECIEDPQEDNPSEERTRDALKFLGSYLSHIDGRSEYPTMLDQMRDLEARLSEDGIASPRHLLLVARKSMKEH